LLISKQLQVTFFDLSHTVQGGNLMSKENLERFYELVRNDATLQKQLANATDADQFADLAVRLGAQSGFAFTADDVRSSIEPVARTGDLSEAELEAVAGGGDYYVVSSLALYSYGGSSLSLRVPPPPPPPGGADSTFKGCY
jgi:predicted ribosomally synthesized peptide with nif11-like leader